MAATYETPHKIVSSISAAPAVGFTGMLLVAQDTGYLYYWDGAAWTLVTAAGSSNYAFKTINCDNGTDPVADSTTDTLNLVSGTGITITGDSSTDTVTIAATGGSGNVPDLTTDIVWQGHFTNIFQDLPFMYPQYGFSSDSGYFDVNDSASTQPGIAKFVAKRYNNSGSSEPGYIGLFQDQSSSSGATGGTTIFGGGTWKFKAYIKIPTLSDATDRFVVHAGFTSIPSATSTADMVDLTKLSGCFFRYSDNINSGKWQMVSTKYNTGTTSDSGSTVDTNWVKLGVTVNSAGTSAEFFVNDVSKGTISTNIPTTAATATCAGLWIGKSAGTVNERHFLADYLIIRYTP